MPQDYMTEQSIGELVRPVVNRLAEETDRVRQFPEPDGYRHWRDNLAGKWVPIHDGVAHPGFYRRKRKAGGFDPVAIFRTDDTLYCKVGERFVDAAAEWSWVFAHPISEEEYRRVAEQGLPWSDMDETVAAALSAPAVPGSNEPADEAEILKDQIESAKAGAADYAKISDDAHAARAQSLRSRLLELSRSADKRREALKKPFLEGGKAVDTKWQPLVREAKDIADQIAKAMSLFESEKARVARKAEEERRRAEEEARKAAETGGPQDFRNFMQEHDPGPAPAAAPTTAIKPAYGRAASVRVVWIAEIEDQDLVYGAFRDRQEVAAVLQKLAQQAVNDGHKIPGVTAREERKVS